MARTNTEEGSASFRGFVPEVFPTQEAGFSPPFVLIDESGSEASYQSLDTPLEETNAGASTLINHKEYRLKSKHPMYHSITMDIIIQTDKTMY